VELLAEPAQEQMELVAGGSEDGFGAIVPMSVDMVALLAVIGLGVADPWLGLSAREPQVERRWAQYREVVEALVWEQ
jgi:hypothetical protein